MSPCFLEAVLGNANIGVVIAGNHRDPIRRADALQPGPRRRELGFEREIDEIAGYRDVIRRLRICMSDTSVSSTSRRWYLWRLRVQLR